MEFQKLAQHQLHPKHWAFLPLDSFPWKQLTKYISVFPFFVLKHPQQKQHIDT